MKLKDLQSKSNPVDPGSPSSEHLLLGKYVTEAIALDHKFVAAETNSRSFETGYAMRTSALGKVIQALPLPAIVIDESQIVICANAGCKKIHPGYAEIQDKPLSQFFPNASIAQKISALVDAAFSTKRTVASEATFEIGMDRIWARMTFRPIRITDKRYLLVLVEDLSSEKRQILIERKHREDLEKRFYDHAAQLKKINRGLLSAIEECKRTEIALQASEKRFQQVVEKTNDVIFVTDDKGLLTFVNPVALKISGYSEHELLGKQCLDYVHPEYKQQVECFYESHRAEHSDAAYYEFPIVSKHGDTVWLGQSTRMVMNEGAVGDVQHICRNINDLKRAEHERDTLRAQLLQAQKMEAVGMLASGIAHDFNNMLTVIIGFAELLLFDRDESDPLYADLQSIMQTALGGADLVQGLLNFSRKAEIGPSKIDVNHQIEETKRILCRIIPRMIDLELKLAEVLAPIHAVPFQVNQILMNLVINARDAMPEGGKLIIRTDNVFLNEAYCRNRTGVKPGKHVLIEVSDTGHGMDPNTLERIFDPFFTTKSGGGSTKGSGLGLAVVHGIVEQHGGHITCQSELGKGTTFKIYIPAVKTEGTGALGKDEPITQEAADRILIVDDEDALRDLGVRVLSRAGYGVLTAANGSEALEIYREQHENISLVMLDLIMPEMNGHRCLEELVKINPQVKVLIATGQPAPPMARESGKMNANSYLAKPYNVSQLLQAVRDAFN